MSAQMQGQVKAPWLLIGLVASVLATSVGVVYAKHQSRKVFIELNKLHTERDALNVEWGQLQLELSTLATHGRVEQIAREKLKMITPAYEQVLIVKP